MVVYQCFSESAVVRGRAALGTVYSDPIYKCSLSEYPYNLYILQLSYLCLTCSQHYLLQDSMILISAVTVERLHSIRNRTPNMMGAARGYEIRDTRRAFRIR